MRVTLGNPILDETLLEMDDERVEMDDEKVTVFTIGVAVRRQKVIRSKPQTYI